MVLFYKSKDISDARPGKDDKVTVWKDGVKTHEQKYLVLQDLAVIHRLFLVNYNLI